MVICGFNRKYEGVFTLRWISEPLKHKNGSINELKNWLRWKYFRTDFSFDLGICIGQGAYICGEETALIASIEGRRASRCKTTFPATEGLYKTSK